MTLPHTALPWYVVAYDNDADPEDEVWTLSRNPGQPGWKTDGGYSEYGLTKSDAQELADGANNSERLTAENAKLKEALRFYADDKNWIMPTKENEYGDVEYIDTDSPVEKDDGEIARAALTASSEPPATTTPPSTTET